MVYIISLIMVIVFVASIYDKISSKDVDIDDLIFGFTVSASVGMMIFLFTKMLEMM